MTLATSQDRRDRACSRLQSWSSNSLLAVFQEVMQVIDGATALIHTASVASRALQRVRAMTPALAAA